MEHLLSRQEITIRLGQGPEHWNHLGQIYDTGPGNERICALTLEPARICLTIKPKVGKGRMTISDKAIQQFERWNPDLYIKLKTSVMWFTQIHLKAVADSFAEQAEIRRLREAEKKYNDIKKQARSRIQQYRQINRGALPEYLKAMRELLQRPGHYFETDSAKLLWYEQGTVAIEKALYVNPAAENNDPLPQVKQPEPVQPLPASRLERERLPVFDIPELDF